MSTVLMQNYFGVFFSFFIDPYIPVGITAIALGSIPAVWKGRVHPWMWAFGGLVPCSTVPQWCSEGVLAPFYSNTFRVLTTLRTLRFYRLIYCHQQPPPPPSQHCFGVYEMYFFNTDPADKEVPVWDNMTDAASVRMLRKTHAAFINLSSVFRGDLSLDTQWPASTGISAQPQLHPYISWVFICQYVSVSEPICTVDRRFIQAPQYQCKTDYDPSVFIIFTFSSLYLHAPSLLTHRYLVTHYCYYSKPIMFPVLFLLPVLTWAPFWFTADLYHSSKHGRKVSGSKEESACRCKSIFACGWAWIPQSQMQPV